MQRDDLSRELFDRRDAVGEVATGMRRLAGDLHFHEHAALAARYDVARRPAGLRIKHRARPPRPPLYWMVGQPAGEPISSSDVNSPTKGAGAPPNFWKAASTNAFMTSP